MGLKWIGEDFDALQAKLEATSKDALFAATDVLQETMQRAEYDIKRIISISNTKTGEERARAGEGVAGRIETGEMYDSVKSRITSYIGDSARDTIVGEAGWLDDTDEEVMERAFYQEEGTERIAPMNALYQVFSATLPEMKARMAAKGFSVE